MLKPISNEVSRHQEVGRGLRLSVNRNGERMDHPSTVHEINNLTVVANESYKEFVESLQKEMMRKYLFPPQKGRCFIFHRETNFNRRRSYRNKCGDGKRYTQIFNKKWIYRQFR